ncbi:MAG: hypothetical protein C0518_13620 [Opitutus sp.]|nr:hypothetical protein [Opitutus sp.]
MTSRFLTAGLVASLCLAAPASARLGDTAAVLRERFGAPETQPNKHTSAWLIEAPAGALVYTVTFDEKGASIAEGLKPYRFARILEQTARDFIDNQLSALGDPSKVRIVKAGERYQFDGEAFTCGPKEQVWVDEAANFLLIWIKGEEGSVMAVTREMLRATRR